MRIKPTSIRRTGPYATWEKWDMLQDFSRINPNRNNYFVGVLFKPKSGRHVYRHNNYPFLTALFGTLTFPFWCPQVGNVLMYLLQYALWYIFLRQVVQSFFRKGPQPLMWAGSQAALIQLTGGGTLTTRAAYNKLTSHGFDTPVLR